MSLFDLSTSEWKLGELEVGAAEAARSVTRPSVAASRTSLTSSKG
jgi:hypothetical protein